METIELLIPCPPERRDTLVAELYSLGFDGFEETPDAVKAYVAADRYDRLRSGDVDRVLREQGVAAETRLSRIAPLNWNAIWEAGVRAVQAGRFLVRPGWVEPTAAQQQLESILIEPKMSFGTGHHETTRLVLGLIEDVVKPGNSVLDAGTGTGVLAIAAVLLGARRAIAFDNDPWSEMNARENAERNGVGDRVEVRLGEIDVVEETGFDVILANIQLNVLVELLGAFESRLSPAGCLVLSGLLRSDRERMVEAARRFAFELEQEAGEGEWYAAVFRKGMSRQ